MAKLYSKNTWTDEVLANAAKYLVKDDDGNTVYENALIQLATEVITAGSPVNAERMQNIEDGIDALDDLLVALQSTFGLDVATEITVAGGVLTLSQTIHKIQPETSTADDIDTLAGLSAGQFGVLTASDAGTDTLTFKHGTGNISCSGGSDIDLSEGAIIVYYDGTTYYVSGGGGGGGISPSEFTQDGGILVGTGAGTFAEETGATARGSIGAIGELSDDATPQLGGDLDLNGHSILNLSKFVCNGRLTLESGVAISTTEQVDKTTLYFTPYMGNEIGLYNGADWERFSFAELSIDISGFTASKPYDIYIYDNAGTLTLSGTAWTDATTRATALTTQDGVYVKTGATNYRYLGTIYIDAAQKCQDTIVKGNIQNFYNQVPRLLYVKNNTLHTYNGTIRLFNNSETANRLEFICGSRTVISPAMSGALKAPDGSYATLKYYIDGAQLDDIGMQLFNYNAQYLGGASSFPVSVSAGYHYGNVYEIGDNATSTFAWCWQTIVRMA